MPMSYTFCDTAAALAADGRKTVRAVEMSRLASGISRGCATREEHAEVRVRSERLLRNVNAHVHL
jgi:hypothetical protein